MHTEQDWWAVRMPGTSHWQVFYGLWQRRMVWEEGPLLLPFNGDCAWQLVIKHRQQLTCLVGEPLPILHKGKGVPSWSFEQYAMAVQAAQQHFATGSLEKVVLSVRWRYPWPVSTGWMHWAERMAHRHPEAMVWIAGFSKGIVWCGASPEPLLIGSKGRTWHTVALAGTATDANGFTSKEYTEQASVAHHIQHVLYNMGIDPIVEGPVAVPTAELWHLQTHFKWQYMPPIDISKLIRQLHPSPAVVGHPIPEAIAFIRQYEPHRRHLYTGLVGWFSVTEPRLYVNLRCVRMDLRHQHADFFAGGGITSESDPRAEWIEIRRKLALIQHPWRPSA